MYGEELKEIYGQPTLGPWNLSHVRTWPFLCVLWPLRETVGSEQWGNLEEVLRNRFQSDTALRFLDVKLPDQQGLRCVQLSLGEFELGWGTPGLGHNWEVPPTGLSGCFSPDQMLSWAPHMGSALNILRLPGLPRLSEKSPAFAWSALLPEDASFSVSVSLFGVSQAKDSVTSLWALAPLLNQKLSEDRTVTWLAQCCTPSPLCSGLRPPSFSVRVRSDGTCFVSSCECVCTDICVCVCVILWIPKGR